MDSKYANEGDPDELTIEDMSSILAILFDAFDKEHSVETIIQCYINNNKNNKNNNNNTNSNSNDDNDNGDDDNTNNARARDPDYQVLREGAFSCLATLSPRTRCKLAFQEWKVIEYGGSKMPTIQSEQWQYWQTCLQGVSIQTVS